VLEDRQQAPQPRRDVADGPRQLADIPDVRLHDLRHSVASDAINDGVPLEVVGKMLGHKNYRTTQRYAHIADTALRERGEPDEQEDRPRRPTR
jgi:site-specific recombinase XerD